MNTVPSLSLADRHALVCGASDGIGKAVAACLAGLGAQVTLLARREKELAQVTSELAADREQTHSYAVLDLADTDRLPEAVDQLIRSRGPFNILINNAGGPAPGRAFDADPADYMAGFKPHILANQILVKKIVPGMTETGYGRIVNIISTSIKQPIMGLGVSNTIRGAVASWSKTLAMELGGTGITVNNVLPGYTKTTRFEAIIKNRAEKASVSEEQAWKAARQEIPLGRFAEPEEIAYAVAFLASPAAAYVSGTNLIVDGARTSSL